MKRFRIGAMSALLAMTTPTAALANSSTIFIRITYFDRGEVVGQYVQLCDGTIYSNGRVTGDNAYEEYPC